GMWHGRQSTRLESAGTRGRVPSSAALARSGQWVMVIDTVRLLLFPAMMAFAASSDLLTMTISNRISLILLAGFFVLAGLTGMPLATLGMHLGAALLVFAATFVMFACGWLGGGDAKLAAAPALWLGFGRLLTSFIFAVVFVRGVR